MNYNVLAVKCNGSNTKYHTENEEGKLAIYIGDKDVLLNPGEYDYTIVYESYGQVGFFDDQDELYWNVTGNEWIFPIEEASAAITLPGNAKAGNTACYTGVSGSTQMDCSVDDRGNTQVFTANNRLAVREGLTVAVAFPRDIISRPPPPGKAEIFWDDNSRMVCGWLGLVTGLGYFLLSLLKVGKRPEKPVAIPTFKPPRDLSPASVQYLSAREYGNKVFAATLVEMAVKGAINIKCEKKGRFSLKEYSLVNKANTEQLRSEEQKVHKAIFANSEAEATIEVDNKNHVKFYEADTGLKSSMQKQWNLDDFFRENKPQVIVGGLILSAIFALYIFLTGMTEEVAWAFAVASPFIALAFLFFFAGGFGLKAGCATFGIGAMVVFLLVGTVLATIVEDDSEIVVHWLSVGFFALMSLAYALYARRLRFFTEDGAKLAAELDGFKMYIKTAEEHRLNMFTPPERTPELFEKLLPYAIALNVSNEWCKKFGDVLKQFNYSPEWYKGEDIAVVGFASTFASLGSSFSSSVSTVSTPAGSSDWSSGSGGGGYSGGGGGGGGGRGW